MKDLNFSYGFTNPAAGPVYIEGAEPGDVLVVDIYDVQVADHGVIATDDHCGPLYQTTDYRSKIIPIEDGMADFNGVKFPIDPMIGVIGTAPDGEDVIDGFVGAHGGNLDNKLITKGHAYVLPPCACRARCCKWATCTPPWAMPSCAARASRSRPRSR